MDAETLADAVTTPDSDNPFNATGEATAMLPVARGALRPITVIGTEADAYLDDMALAKVLRSVELAGLATEVARLHAQFVIKDADKADD